MQRIKSEMKLQLLLPPQTSTNLQGSPINKINEMSKISLNILIKKTIYKTTNKIQRHLKKE
jgi:hypothetical protein